MTEQTEPLDTERLPANVRDALNSEGFTGNFDLIDGDQVRCHTCDEVHAPSDVSIEEIHRYEGVTNPGDEESILALVCPCGCKGLATAAMGAYADGGVGDALRAMPDHRRD